MLCIKKLFQFFDHRAETLDELRTNLKKNLRNRIVAHIFATEWFHY